jgi:hypothetical protein
MGNHLSGCFGLKARAGAPDAVSLREGERDENKGIVIRTKKIIKEVKFYTWRQCMLACCNCVFVCARQWVRRLCNTASLDVNLSLTDKFMSNLMYGLTPQNASKTPHNDKSSGTSCLSDFNELGTNEAPPDAPPDAPPASSQLTDLSRGVSEMQKATK